jgi:hypothetical protein
VSKRRRTKDKPAEHEAVVWIDHDQALIVEQASDGGQSVELLDRRPAESEAAFEARTVDEVVDDDRVVVSGPAFARTDFERAYVAVTHRPDRLVDVEPKTPTSRKVRRTAEIDQAKIGS